MRPDPSTDTASAPDRSPANPPAAEPARESASSVELMGRRRRFLIDGSTQVRSGLIITGIALILVVLVNLSLHGARMQALEQIATVSPQLVPVIESHNQFELYLGLGASFVLLVGIFVVTILETHKTAGAAYNLSRKMEQIRSGSYGARLGLRAGDNLREVEEGFDSMSQALARRVGTDIEELESAASWADRVSSPMEARDLAARLRELADERRRCLPGLPSSTNG